jgi:hypothetical protein
MRHITFKNTLGKTLRYCGLTDTRLTYQAGIILLPAVEYLYNTLRLLLAPDYSVELTVSGFPAE